MSERDASLLFGVFAVQFKKITPQQLHEVAGQWQKDPSRELSRMLVESGYLTEEDYNHIHRLVDDARRAHDGDPSAALQTFGGQRMVDETYADAITLSQDQIRTVPMPEGAIPGVPIDNIDAVDETPGRYTNQSEYARGGIGRVLLVHDQHLGREIAMKELLPFTDYVDESMKLEKSPVRQSMALITRFLQEARVTGQLEHPSIVPVYELGRRRDGTLYYTMKLVRGRTLAGAIREAETLTKRLALLSHFVDLCQAIAYSHSRRVIHRDIKPSNVMVGKFGETVVLDWGLAKVKDKQDDAASQMEETLKTLRLPAAKGHETHAGQILGTPAYMPPEQAAGQIERIDERSDVYALGAVLYTMLTGKYPYDGDNASEILNRLLVGPPKPVLEVEPTAPPELAAICERAMQREADRRYKNAKDLAEDVIRFQTGALVLAHSYKFKDHLARFVQQHKPALATAALFTVALAAFATYSYIRVTHERNDAITARNDAVAARDSEAEQRQAAVQARENEAQQRRAAEGLLYQSNIRLAQSQIEAKRFDLAMAALDAAPAEYRGWEWDYLNGLCHQDLWTFAPGERGLLALAVSNDGAFIVVGGNSGAAYIVDGNSGKLLKKLEGQTQSVNAVAINPSGTRVLTASDDQTAIVWDSATGTALFTLSGHTMPLTEYCSFTPDGEYAITTAGDSTVRMWNAKDGALVHTFTLDGGGVLADMSADGSRIAAGSTNGAVKVWSLSSGQELLSDNIQPRGVTAIQFGPRGDSLVVGCNDGSVYAWKTLEQPSSNSLLTGHMLPVDSIAFTADGKQFITASLDGTVRIWRAEDLSLLHVIDAHGERVIRVAANPVDSTFLSVSADHTAKLFDAPTGGHRGDWNGHSDVVRRCKFMPDGKEFVTIAGDGTLKAWRTAPEFQRGPIYLRHDGPVRQVLFNASGSSLLTRCDLEGADSTKEQNNCVRVWDLQSGEHVAELGGNRVDDAEWNPEGTKIATGSADKTASVWDAATGKELFRLTGHTAPVTSVNFSPDGSLLLTTSRDKSAILWRVSDGEKVTTLAGYGEEVFGGEFSPDGSRIATLGKRRELCVFETATGKLIHNLGAHEVRINALFFLNDNVRMISATGDGEVILWDTTSGQIVRRFEGHAEAVWHAALSPDEKYIATASLDATIRICDIDTGKVIHTCGGHSGSVWHLSYSPDGERLVSCAEDGSVRLWDSHSGKELLVLRDHADEVNSVHFSTDGTAIASASNDGLGVIWRVKN